MAGHPDEVKDVQDLDMFLDVNGKRMQTGNTKTMIFGVAHLVSYISQFMQLEPGDVITTGTPPGVGMGMKPPVFLKAGDTVRLGIEASASRRRRSPPTRAEGGRSGRRRTPDLSSPRKRGPSNHRRFQTTLDIVYWVA